MSGGEGSDTLLGSAGTDERAGGLGADIIRAAGGTDTLSGGPGDDTIVLKATSTRATTIDCGDGDDTFVLNGAPKPHSTSCEHVVTSEKDALGRFQPGSVRSAHVRAIPELTPRHLLPPSVWGGRLDRAAAWGVGQPAMQRPPRLAGRYGLTGATGVAPAPPVPVLVGAVAAAASTRPQPYFVS